MSPRIKALLAVLLLTTLLLACRDVQAQWNWWTICDTPATGTCQKGWICTGTLGVPCTLNGTGSWSVCITAGDYWCSGTYSCNGNFIDLNGQPRGACSCGGAQFSPSGC